jgi:Xaa-Pro aminopeptidase
MQYSPQCAIPYVSNVDAGTVELVRAQGAEVVSSVDLVQLFEARWSPRSLELHLDAGRRVDKVRAEAFELIRARTRGGECPTEFEVQQFIGRRFAELGLVVDHPPVVAVNANASDPHYSPQAASSAVVRHGDLVLIDMWAKMDDPEAVYYDITWMAFCGDNPPDELARVFSVVRDARDAGIRLVTESVAAGRPLRGFEVDDAVRGCIADHGFGRFFTHRTGHSIGRSVHGNGANMDNLETHDERMIIPWTAFSIEPGVYLPGFGVRSEVNVFIGEGKALVTGEIQHELLLL